MSDLPPAAVEHLYPFLVLGGLAVAVLGGLVGLVLKGQSDLKKMMLGVVAAAYATDENGKEGVAALGTRRIVQEAFASNLSLVTKAIGDIETRQEKLQERLETHEQKEFERGDARDTALKAEISRNITDALRFPREVAAQYKALRDGQDAHGKQLDQVAKVVDTLDHRVRLLEVKG